ncbi:MAG: hypothetical protein Q8922_01660 [Bacteroidota bacterium]|nr:hypothetical protein [Bacteroidota bacterium]MDP4232066.1 hypothetical protein [Bacteroidota bacterium]MDP4241227.1 hypothetical protein [Bacteroidota bacterium]MDP4286619.1 hypothetical protein [Bacteroidota bacterium]
MKSFWLLSALIVPLVARGQDRLQFQAVVTMHDTGSWGGWSKWDTIVYGGTETRTLTVWFGDTLSIIGDSIAQTVRAGSLDAYATAIFDRTSTAIRHLRITGSGSPYYATDRETYQFTIAIDSLPVAQSAGPILTIDPGSYVCQTTSSYSWSHPGGPEGFGGNLTQSSGSGSDSGLTTFEVLTASSGVRMQNANSGIRIVSIAGGAVQIEAERNGPNEPIEIFDDLGRIIYRANFEGGSVQIMNLCAGCYFARLGGTCAKFIVTE